MPWHVELAPSRCGASKPWAVVKDADGSIAGCHATRVDAEGQMAALYANEGGGRTMPVSATNNAASATTVVYPVEVVAAGPPREDLFRGASNPPEIRGESAAPTLAGHFAVFDEWAEINSLFEGRFLERIAPGAFAKTITENRDRMRVLFQHGRDPMIGDKPLGTIDELEEDGTGARYEVGLLDTSYNRDLLPGLRNDLYGSSFRMQVIKDDFVREPKKSDYNPEGLPERTLREVRVREFGPVTWPAYSGATAGLRESRSLTDRFLFEERVALARRIDEAAEEVLAALVERLSPALLDRGAAMRRKAREPGRRPTPRPATLTKTKEKRPWELP